MSFRKMRYYTGLFILQARTTATYVPIAAFAAFSFVATFLVIPLPETHFRDLPETIEEVLQWPRTQSKEEWTALREVVRRRKAERKVILKSALTATSSDRQTASPLLAGCGDNTEL